MKPRNRPLKVAVTRDGVLRIEIGMDVLAHAALHSDFCTNLNRSPYVGAKITNNRGFAVDVKRALVDELGEDGSTIVTQALDRACEAAIEDGTQFFVGPGEEA